MIFKNFLANTAFLGCFNQQFLVIERDLQFFRQQASNISSARTKLSSDSSKKASSTKTSAPTMNRAQERKEIAKRKERIRFIEKRTAELEEAQKALEASFGANTPPEDYDTYARNSDELEALYEEYMELESE